MKLWSSKHRFKYLIGLYAVTRLFIWIFRPAIFTEILYSYMPYAHLWDSGYTPYLKQWYEYPPVTIPLFYLPHLIDKATLQTFFHWPYLQAYRSLLLIIDCGLFALIWKVLKKQQVSQKVLVTALIYYSLVTAKAHHFLYDTMDLTFAAALALGVAAPILWSKWKGWLVGWLGFFLAIGLKLLNAPLGVLYLLLERKHWKWSLGLGLLAFLLVWAIPLMIFRSSLQVILVYHQQRGIQVDSAVGIILRALNVFTETEQVQELFKNYEIVGPMTEVAKKIMNVLFPVSLLAYLSWAAWRVWKAPTKLSDYLKIHFTLGYILLLMLVAKVLSTPFLLWHIPLLAMYPFQTQKDQLRFLIPSAAIIILSMTSLPNFMVGPFHILLVVGMLRTGLFGYLFWQWLRYSSKALAK